MERNIIETVMGAVVLVVAIGFVVFAYNSSSMSTSGTYPIVAVFNTVDGISSGSDVRIGGIKVGVVNKMELMPDSFRAKVVLDIREGVKVPEDSSAAIVSESLLGNRYVAIEPGGADEMLPANGEISITQSSVNIESLIGRFMFSGGGVDAGKTGSDAAASPEGEVLEHAPVAPEDDEEPADTSSQNGGGAAAPTAEQKKTAAQALDLGL